MKTVVVIDGRAAEIEIERNGEGCTFRLDGVVRQAELSEVEPGIYSVLLEGRSFEVKIWKASSGYWVETRGQRLAVEAFDPRDRGSGSRAANGAGRAELRAPMPGKVIRVLVADGDNVEAGQGIVVVEAMKMQNEMKAPKSGRVVGLKAREGATVVAGEVLATIE